MWYPSGFFLVLLTLFSKQWRLSCQKAFCWSNSVHASVQLNQSKWRGFDNYKYSGPKLFNLPYTHGLTVSLSLKWDLWHRQQSNFHWTIKLSEICNRKKPWGLRTVKFLIFFFLRLRNADIIQEPTQRPGDGGGGKYGKGQSIHLWQLWQRIVDEQTITNTLQHPLLNHGGQLLD